MANSYNFNDKLVFEHFVYYPVLPNSNSMGTFGTDEFPYPVRVWILR